MTPKLVAPEVEAYAEAHTAPEPPLLAELRQHTYAHLVQPHMTSGHLQGRFLSLLSQLISPKLAVEVGTFTGYAALSLAEGLAPGGTLHTLEVDPHRAEVAQHFFDQSPLGAGLKLHMGDARLLLPTLPTPWDLVFLDARKEDYLDYYELIVPRLRPGGLLITDNVLWYGNVVDNSARDSATTALRAYNKRVMDDSRVEVVLLPVRDGLSLARKK